MVAIARRNLFADIPRLLVAQAGIAFAVGLVTIQAGILQGFTRSTALLVEQSDADLWVGSEQMVHLELTQQSLSSDQLDSLRQIEGVERAEALLIGSNRWISPAQELAPVRIFGFDPAGELFRPGTLVEGHWADLNQPFSAIVDESNLDRLGIAGVGEMAEINLLFVQTVGLTRGTQSIASSSFIYTSLTNAYDYVGAPFSVSLEDSSVLGPATYFLVRVAPDRDMGELKQQIEAALPGNLAYTKAEMMERTQAFWRESTGIGFILGLGATVGTIVGVAIVSQILYASVSDRLKDFGTLKAMGASDWTIYSIILKQALWMAVLGYIPGMALCWGLSTWALATQGILILISPELVLGVFGLTVAMCSSSAVFAIQKVTRVDPSIVFKS
ncbi:ABC transporter permease [Synechococcus sp. PCC 7336]|uniref:ABC transporter permease n=1 Tax=Synechococcus sp. PCC 7336 TaxID=195250 RepID=UPI0003478B63|nr:ABC transporter permease [Synechococcus sp. PCC 7336]